MGTIIKKSDSRPPLTLLLSFFIPEKYNSKEQQL